MAVNSQTASAAMYIIFSMTQMKSTADVCIGMHTAGMEHQLFATLSFQNQDFRKWSCDTIPYNSMLYEA